MKRTVACTCLQGLKTALEEKGRLPENRTPKERSLQVKTDEELFREAMADVREISEFREIPAKTPPSVKGRTVCGDDDSVVLQQIVNGERKIRLSDTGEYMEWTSPQMRRDITKKLHEGGFSVQDSIDLHGMTLVEAEEALTRFFREAVRRRLFCVKVIHGRGLRSPRGPVLKEAFRRMLHGQFRKWVLAYSSAKDCDGGLGATYIMLKSR